MALGTSLEASATPCWKATGRVPCCLAIICLAILQFPNVEAVRRWYDSPENQSAAKVRQRGAKFCIIAIEGLPDQR